ncbi:MAG: hypothetical protein HZA22_13795 [Nitrospirae bacterium]|nr:hypothetical protein [Nitrospirota bacterium]MBI5694606.1 hypothetical protein [Nitrospirota bacterium]
MKATFRFLLLLGALVMFLQSGWVSYSSEKDCPYPPKEEGPVDKARFLSAHGLTQDNYSIWLKEHSVWRRKYADELKTYTFIPQDFDTERSE